MLRINVDGVAKRRVHASWTEVAFCFPHLLLLSVMELLIKNSSLVVVCENISFSLVVYICFVKSVMLSISF
jgi:hypothetical protein